MFAHILVHCNRRCIAIETCKLKFLHKFHLICQKSTNSTPPSIQFVTCLFDTSFSFARNTFHTYSSPKVSVLHRIVLFKDWTVGCLRLPSSVHANTLKMQWIDGNFDLNDLKCVLLKENYKIHLSFIQISNYFLFFFS